MATQDDSSNSGFKDGDNGDGVFGDPSAGAGSTSDYDSWTWKQIEAAITGMAAATGSAGNEARAKAVADPTTLQTAADAFFTVQNTLAGVAKALADQADALAGDKGPWKGAVADAFHTSVTNFSKQVQANADRLAGGSGGSNNVPQQLANNSVNLKNAQKLIHDIDNWYSHQAVLMGVQPMSNGLIPVSQKPEIVEMLNHDMRAVLKSLAQDYQVTSSSLVAPDLTPPPTTGNDGGGPPPGLDDTPPPTSFSPPGGDPNLGAPPPSDLNDLSAMPFPNPGTGGGPNTDLAGDLAPFSAPTGLGAGGPGGDPALFSGGPGGGAGSLGGDLAPFPDPTGVGAGSLGGGSLAPDPGALDGLLNPTTATPTPFPGSPDTGAGGGLGAGLPFLPPPFPGGTNSGGTGDPFKGVAGSDSGAFGDAPPVEDFPGSTGLGGPAESFPNIGEDGLGAGGLPAGMSTGSGLPAGFPGALGTGGADAGLGGGGMPFMPGGLGGAQPGVGGEPSDASALLAPSAEPFAGDTGLDAGVGSDVGAAAGGEGLGGMPFMPGGLGGAQPGVGGEPSDASALLAPSAEPFAGDAGLDAGVGSDVGAAAGGEGLDLDGAAGLPGASGTGGAGAGMDEGGMPFMPGMMGGGPGDSQSGAGGESSDASALLASSAEPWTGDSEPGDEIGAEAGTLPGRETLGAPVHAAAAEIPATTAVDSNGNPVPAEGETTAALAAEGEGESATAGSASGGAGLIVPGASSAATASAIAAPEPAAAVSSVSAEVPGGQAAATMAEPSAWYEGAGADEELTGPAGVAALTATAAAAAVVNVAAAAPAAPAAAESRAPSAAGEVAWTSEAGGGTSVTEAPRHAGTSGDGSSTGAAETGHHGHQDRDHHQDGLILVGLPTGRRAADEEREGRGRQHGPDEPEGPDGTGRARRIGGSGRTARPRRPGSARGTARQIRRGTGRVPRARRPGRRPEAHRGRGSGGRSRLGRGDEGFAPLLWSIRTEEESEVRAPGNATAPEGTWGETPGGADTGAEGGTAEADVPQLAAWRPNRQSNAPATTVVPPVYRSGDLPDDYVPEEAPAGDSDDAEKEEGVEAKRGVADLLVQDEDSWGALPVGPEVIG